MKYYRLKSSYPSNSLAKRGLKATFYFKNEIIPNESALRNDNKQKLRPIIKLYEVIFSKMNILS